MKKMSDGQSPSPRPTDQEIHVFSTLRHQNQSIGACVRAIGDPNTKLYYSWMERGGHKDPDMHVKFPQCRKFYLSLLDAPPLKRGPKQGYKPPQKPIQKLPHKNIFDEYSNGKVEKDLISKVLFLISTPMADGSRSLKDCLHCQSSGVHTTDPMHCDCICHSLRDYLSV